MLELLLGPLFDREGVNLEHVPGLSGEIFSF